MTSVSEPATVFDILAAVRKSTADVLLAPTKRLTGQTLWAVTRKAEAVLAAEGVGAHSRIGLLCGDGPQTAVAFLATTTVGVCVPVNPAMPVNEIDRHLKSMDVDTLVVTDDVDGRVEESLADIGWSCLRLPDLDADTADSDWPPRHLTRTPGPDDVCLLLATSGTTSKPKIVPLTHGNLVASARNIANTLALSPRDRGLLVMPLFHIHGLMAGLLAPLYAQGGVYCLPGRQPEKMLSALGSTGVTWYSAVPSIHQGLVDAAADAAPPGHTLRFVRSSSAPMTGRLIERLESLLGVPVVEAYGMTEASHQMASNPLPPAARVVGSVGMPTGPRIRVVDSAGDSVPSGEIGEIVIQGDSVTSGYLDNPEANSDAYLGRWFRTGDEGFFDEAGYLHLSGRTKEVINRGGEKVFPSEVDDVLVRHPAVAQAMTFSIGHERLGEDVGAAIVIARDAAVDVGELQLFASEYLAPFKVPRRIFVVDELPKGPTGKMQRIGMEARIGASSETTRQVIDEGSENSIERAVTAEWRQVLNLAEISPMDDFFNLGGDSIQAVRLMSVIEEKFGVELPIAAIFTTASFPRGMSQLIMDIKESSRTGLES